jgi:hypothetical protein
MGIIERMGDFAPEPPKPVTEEIRRETGARPTGAEIFNAKSPAEQDAMLGPKAAEAVRAGEVGLEELVERSPLDTAPDYITQKPLPQEGE